MGFLRNVSSAAALLLAFVPGVAGAAQQAESSDVWTVAYDHLGNATALAPTGLQQLTGFDLTCSRDREIVIQAVVPGRANGGGQMRMVLNFSDGASASLTTGWEWEEGTWFNSGDSRLVGLLMGRSEWAKIVLDGRSIGRLSLAGSTRALNEALLHCLRPAPSTTGARAFPPLPHGFYAVSVPGESISCAEAARVEEMGYIYLTPEVWREWDGDTALTRARQTSDGRWRLGTIYFGDMDIVITGPATFHEAGEGSRSFRHCPIESVPARTRRDWIRPGDRTRPTGNG